MASWRIMCRDLGLKPCFVVDVKFVRGGCVSNPSASLQSGNDRLWLVAHESLIKSFVAKDANARTVLPKLKCNFDVES